MYFEKDPSGRKILNERGREAAGHKFYVEGYAFYNAGRKQEALVLFKRAIEFKPDLAQAHNYLGLILHDFGQYEEALVAYARAIELQPRYEQAHNNRGVSLRLLGRLEEALTAFDHAIEINSLAPVIHFNRADVLRALGRFSEAIMEYEYCLYMQYDVPEVTRALFALSALAYDTQRSKLDYATQVRELGGTGNEDDFWFILKQEIEEEIFYHILLTKEKARRRDDGYDRVSHVVDHVLNLNPINLIFGGGFLVSIFKKQVDVRYDHHHQRNSLKIVNTLTGKTWDAESISEFADELSETITNRFAELLPKLSQQGMFTFIKYCVQKLFMFQDGEQRGLSVEDQFLWNLINGVGKGVPIELALTPADLIELLVWAKARPAVSSEQILKSGLLVDDKKYVHPDNPSNPLNYFARSTLKEVEILGYIETP